MKIYFEKPNTKSKTALLDSLYYSEKEAEEEGYYILDWIGAHETFFDKSLKKRQCHDGAYRSFEELELISQTYLNEKLTKEDFFKCKGNFQVYFCHDVEKIVFMKVYSDKYLKRMPKNKNVYFSIDDYEEHLFKEMLDFFEVKI